MWQIIEKSKALTLLERSILDGHLSHAYIFVGPPHVGKRTLAMDLAQALNCEERDAPCGTCASCRRIASGKHSDIQIVDLISREKKEISIDQIREIQVSASLPPYEGKKKVFIIDSADLLSNEAANCLLKTLEELPHYALLILLTANEKLLLPTVASRCQRIELRPLPLDIIKEVLTQQKSMTEQEMDLIVRLSEGCLGWAMLALKDETILIKRTQRLDTLRDIISVNPRQRLNYAAELATLFGKDKEEAEKIIDLWVKWWHDLLLLKYGNKMFITNVDQEPELFEQAGNYSIRQIKGFIKCLQDVGDQLEKNINPRLALELLVLNMPQNQGSYRETGLDNMGRAELQNSAP